MPRYRKKPVEVEVILWTGENLEAVKEFVGESYFSRDVKTNALYINTLEGPVWAQVGYYIIEGVAGEFYPCKPDIFELTYESVDAGRSI